ncbi:MAG: response regulator [Planctomycetota bacterium]|nr:MAG: response regulator [Planctomycetota bacterium]
MSDDPPAQASAAGPSDEGLADPRELLLSLRRLAALQSLTSALLNDLNELLMVLGEQLQGLLSEVDAEHPLRGLVHRLQGVGERVEELARELRSHGREAAELLDDGTEAVDSDLAGPQTAPPPRAPASPPLALIVEDQALVRSYLAELLRREGYEVLVADCAERAQALLESCERPLGLLLADVVLPGDSGPALARELLRRQPGLPVLFISGYPPDARGVSAEDLGGAPLLLKPFGSDELLAAIREVRRTAGLR